MQTRWLMLSFAGLLAGCQTPPEPVQAPPPPLNIRTAPELSGSSVQTSRYVIERSAGEQMTDILGVPIEARLPVMSKMSIKDGVEFLLSGSGMSLRTPTSYAETQLYAQPLPLGHTDIGHMSLRQAFDKPCKSLAVKPSRLKKMWFVAMWVFVSNTGMSGRRPIL